ncbi:MAG: hypothetical protein M3041_11495 [Acidobacteriota bacterium]|nr:hypothetical protein [Acidobacteriota bacterium]
MEPDVRNLRGRERFRVKQRLSGSFGAAEVTLIDVAEEGAQIEHAQPLRLASKGRLWFKRADVSASLHAFVVWSRLSKTPNEVGKYLYRSGLRFDEGAGSFLEAMRMLADQGVIERDDDSLNRKKKRVEEREQDKAGKPIVRMVGTEEISPDQVLLVQHARERLKENFDEAQKWYSRAYFALRDSRVGNAAELMRYPEDVLAVWEYLERSVPLSTIKRVFDQRRDRSQ